MRKSWSLSFESIWFKRCLTSSDSDRLFIAQGDKDISYLKRINILNHLALLAACQKKMKGVE
jgi:hypothetical protein